jgi:signal transduction histidine kinase
MDIKFPKNIFHSARLKLTIFYLIIVLFFSLFSTLSYRFLAQKEFSSGNVAQRNAFQRLIFHDFRPQYYQVPPPTDDIANIQNAQEDTLRHNLDRDIVLINLTALLVGGILSWWFAGRTLLPIEEAHESQKRFASDASHELRTPLANMKVENEVFLRQKEFTNEEAKELILSNLEEVQRLENLSKNLLSMNQYEQIPLKLRKLSTNDLIEKSLATIDKVASEKHISLRTVAAENKIHGDMTSLVRLMSIVLDNAVKYSPESSEISISGRKRGLQYLIKVRDQGQGINSADLPHIFERFYRSDKTRQSNGGYGLGLSLAKEIATANNAKISASNVKGGGAEFTISLDLAK